MKTTTDSMLVNHKAAHVHLDAVRLAMEAGATVSDQIALVAAILEVAPAAINDSTESPALLWRVINQLEGQIIVP